MKNLNLGIINEEKQYTLIARVKEDWTVHEYVVAFRYDAENDCWASGNYFTTVEGAMSFAKEEEDQDKLDRMLYIANIIPDDWFDDMQLVKAVNNVYDHLKDIEEIGPCHVIQSLNNLGY